ADHQVAGGADRQGGQGPFRLDLEQGQVVLVVAGDDAGRVGAAVGQAGAEHLHVVHDVVVGDDVAAGVGDDAGAHGVDGAGGGVEGVQLVSGRLGDGALGVDVDDGVFNLFDDFDDRRAAGVAGAEGGQARCVRPRGGGGGQGGEAQAQRPNAPAA